MSWKEIRLAALKRDGHRCQECYASKGGYISVHHIVPKKRGGTDDLDNLVTLCFDCLVSGQLLRREAMERDNHQCRECETKKDLTVYHVIPRSAGGTDALDNLVTLCRKCHVMIEDLRKARHERKVYLEEWCFA
jgi:5-methylcytosine-specific restriction endonuclease McrA